MNPRTNRRDEGGAGLAEYAILLVFIGVACAAAYTIFGAFIAGLLAQAADSLR